MTKLQELYIEPTQRVIRMKFWYAFCQINQENPYDEELKAEYYADPKAYVRRYNEDNYPVTRARRDVNLPRVRSTGRSSMRARGRILGEPF